MESALWLYKWTYLLTYLLIDVRMLVEYTDYCRAGSGLAESTRMEIEPD